MTIESASTFVSKPRLDVRYKEVGVENRNIIFGRKGLGLLGCKGALKLLQIKVSCSRTQNWPSKTQFSTSWSHMLAIRKLLLSSCMHVCMLQRIISKIRNAEHDLGCFHINFSLVYTLHLPSGAGSSSKTATTSSSFLSST